ncbi:flagellar hook-associated protein FlgK [Klenkia taihuensis]|uniref:Flagellar hook-associated protein 1 n=1 Tax=Klenkia taihuensis TaxID=1225127 RepID=A0A1I1MSL1_9ACTN|nr:flagellar hook-associated protein FlgK [Klenkia taihuensis]GHE14326.1 flagellar hook-associated protein 1 [Klenkia taihuensis]SFC85583.1 flagellar hook-associated protein 1 FlgK [Klenkia taihuensis]
MSGFSSLNVASRALAAQQRAIDVTGQNVANANTVGYTRQRVEMQSLASHSAYGLQSREDSPGNGVSAEKVIRVRDAFLERRAQQQAGLASQAAATAATYSQLETSFGEPGDTGIQSLLTKTSAAWSQLSTRPTDTSSRIAVLSSADALAKGLRTASAAVDAQWSNTRLEATDLVDEANATLAQIAQLNRTIQDSQGNGNPANELQDQRDGLVALLSKTLGATGVEGDNGMVDVVVDGNVLVSGTGASKLALTGGTDPLTMATAPVRLAVAPGGSVLQPGGTVGGQLDAMNTVLPSYQAQLDQVALAVTGVNAVLATGYDKAGAPGTALYGGSSARDITVVITDPAELAAAANPPAGTDASADGALADQVAQLGKAAAGPDATYRQMITALGIASRGAAGAATTASTVLGQVDQARLSVSGVSLDEEMTNLLVFKQSYAAAARVVTALDEMLDVLINKTGLVGR